MSEADDDLAATGALNVHHDAPPLILVSGVPATGKSTFGRWLKDAHGFAHMDVENGGLEPFGLGERWQAICNPQPPHVASFVQTLKQLSIPVVLDWGFPLPYLPFVQTLHLAGLESWWFDGDRAAARQTFIRRGTVPVAALDIQMQNIERHQAQLDDFYGDRVIQAITPHSGFVEPKAILATILARRSRNTGD